MTARTFVLDPLLGPDGAEEILRLAERFDGYGLYVVETSETEFAPELSQRIDAARNYSVDVTGRGIYLQNGTTHNHSLTSPDLGMAAYRNAYIVGELLGRAYYKVEKSIAFQQFTAPEGAL